MKGIIEVHFEILPREELNPEELEDLRAATEAREEAYKPYSNFMVGSAIRTNDNSVFSAWNMENVIYNSLHAETMALGRIPRINRNTGLKRITVVGGPEDFEHHEPVTSCGSCRQLVMEYLQPGDNPEVIMAGTHGEVLRMLLKEMLPKAFYPACVVKK